MPSRSAYASPLSGGQPSVARCRHAIVPMARLPPILLPSPVRRSYWSVRGLESPVIARSAALPAVWTPRMAVCLGSSLQFNSQQSFMGSDEVPPLPPNQSSLLEFPHRAVGQSRAVHLQAGQSSRARSLSRVDESSQEVISSIINHSRATNDVRELLGDCKWAPFRRRKKPEEWIGSQESKKAEESSSTSKRRRGDESSSHNNDSTELN